MNIDNYIESQYRLLKPDLSYEYMDLYKNVSNAKLREIFSTLHTKLITGFKTMNERLPTKDYEAHFWADPSRELISAIEIVEGLIRSLSNSQLVFELDEYYKKLIEQCNTFLSRSGGSTIPTNMDKVDLYYVLPIFVSKNAVTVAAPVVEAISRTYITKISQRALQDITDGSFDSAITKSRTLLEEVFIFCYRAKRRRTFHKGRYRKIVWTSKATIQYAPGKRCRCTNKRFAFWSRKNTQCYRRDAEHK